MATDKSTMYTLIEADVTNNNDIGVYADGITDLMDSSA